MTTTLRTTQRVAHWLRWIARGISTLAAGFWLLILLDILACDVLFGFICLSWENILLVGLVTASVICVMIAWRREGIGGLIMTIWGIAFTVIACVTSRNYEAISMLVTGVPFIFAGLLFLVYWWLN